MIAFNSTGSAEMELEIDLTLDNIFGHQREIYGVSFSEALGKFKCVGLQNW